MTVTVYGAPGCVKCKLTTKEMAKLGIVPDYVENPELAVALSQEHNLGKSLPVVHVSTPAGDQYWGDFRLDRIRGLGEQLVAA